MLNQSLLKKFNEQIEHQLTIIIGNDLPILEKIKQFVMESGGKRVRPQFLLLLANHFSAYDENSTALAAITEIIHAASLLHDDVIDETTQRRGRESPRILFGNRQVILAGDYLLACGLERLNKFHNPDLMDVFTQVIKQLSVAELLQMEYEQNPKITMEIYYQIIYGKTAALFETAALSAGIYAKQNKEVLDILKNLGREIGMLFQIRDDILDYFAPHLLKKPPFQDFENGLYTYPILEFRLHANSKIKEKIDYYLTKLPKEKRKEQLIQKEFLEFLLENKIQERCLLKIEELQKKILEKLSFFSEDIYVNLIKSQINQLCKID